MDERFDDLESRITLQEDMIDELNKTVYRQQIRIDLLETAITELTKRFFESENRNQDVRMPHEKPPHY